MICVNLNPAENSALHNFSLYLLSDIDARKEPSILVSFPTENRLTSIQRALVSLCSVFVTKGVSAHDIDWQEVSSRLMEKTSRALRLVVRRVPKAYRPHEHVPEYLLCYVIEQLECGHEMTVYPEADLLIAKRRVCHQCQDVSKAILPPKKPAHSVKPNPAEEVA